MFKKHWKLAVVMAIFGVLVLALAGCAQKTQTGDETSKLINPDGTSKDTAPKEETGSIKVGAVFPLTGEGAAYGVPMQQVIQIALAKVNSNGGINGRNLEFVWEDGKCNGNDSAAAAQKLISIDQVKIILGGFCSSETLGIAPIAEQSKVVVLSSGSSSPDITNAGDYIFRNYPSDSSQGKIIAQIAFEMGLKKAGLLTEQNDYTFGISKVFKSTFEANGGTVIEQTFLPTDSDFKTQILKLKSEKVDMIFINPQTPTKGDLLLKQLQEQGLKAQLFANDVVMGWTESLTRYKDYVEGMIGAEASYQKDSAEFLELAAKYKEATGKPDLDYAAYSSTTYDAVMIIAEGLKQVGNDAEAFKAFLYGIKNREGLAGTLTIDANGDPLSGHKPEIVKNGKTEPYVSTIAQPSATQPAQDVPGSST
ncbi:ABC transporter substrate-binding protein [Candidatus Peregrinibacteria bacterium]|nr:ABC transporter substrate-binding protein [Candidatus Peregrinibacteria bacterium]